MNVREKEIEIVIADRTGMWIKGEFQEIPLKEEAVIIAAKIASVPSAHPDLVLVPHLVQVPAVEVQDPDHEVGAEIEMFVLRKRSKDLLSLRGREGKRSLNPS